MKYYFFTGAGLSKESGINTFRDENNGTWVNHDLGKVCNFWTYRDNLELVFDFYSKRKEEMLKAQPNDAHKLLAKIQGELGPENVIIVTQNIDDLLERAGCTNIIHLHGNCEEMKCYGCGHIWNIGSDLCNQHTTCPRCSCRKAIKPNVVFFNEKAPEYARLHIIRKTIQHDDLFVAIGTSFNVVTEEDIIPRSRFGSEKNIQINPELTEPKYFGINLAITASDGLKQLIKQGIFNSHHLKP